MQVSGNSQGAALIAASLKELINVVPTNTKVATPAPVSAPSGSSGHNVNTTA